MSIEQLSPTANRVDLALADGETLATLEFKGFGAASVSYWIVSGKSDEGLPSILLALSMPMRGTREVEFVNESLAIANDFVFPLARYLAKTPGAGQRVPPLSVEARQMLFNEHMIYHFDRQRSGNLTLQVQTEALFKMATFLEVVAPLKLIAAFQGVAVSTVETRIKKGRASGAIPKASEVRARTKALKKGE